MISNKKKINNKNTNEIMAKTEALEIPNFDLLCMFSRNLISKLKNEILVYRKTMAYNMNA